MAATDQAQPESALVEGEMVWVRAELRRRVPDAGIPDTYLVRVFSPNSGAFHYVPVHVSQIKAEG